MKMSSHTSENRTNILATDEHRWTRIRKKDALVLSVFIRVHRWPIRLGSCGAAAHPDSSANRSYGETSGVQRLISAPLSHGLHNPTAVGGRADFCLPNPQTILRAQPSPLTLIYTAVRDTF